MGRPVVFLDRDGTLIQEAHYLTAPKQVRLYRDVPKALRALRNAGFKLVVVTNQSGIGRGWVSDAIVKKINQRMKDLLYQAGGVRLDGIFYCPHTPWELCRCRKPEVGLAKEAKRQLGLDFSKAYVIGDKIIDVLFAKSLHIKGVFLLTGHGQEEISRFRSMRPLERPDFIARRFSQAATWILNQ